MRVLLTGAASLVGAEVLRELLLRPELDDIRLLMTEDEAQRQESILRLEAYAGWLARRVTVVVAGEWRGRDVEYDVIFHVAGRETPDDDLLRAREANVAPVDALIAMLERNPTARLHHLSTAMTAGTRCGLYTEFDLDCGQQFHNAWEQSKYEAEVRLRGSRVSDRVTIYRPSHVLGNAGTGDAFSLGGAYPLLASLSAAAALPADAKARIDFVPADYVARAMVVLAAENATGTFHLACGWHESPTIREAAELASRSRGRTRGPRLVPRGVAAPMRLAGTANPGQLVSRALSYQIARDLLHPGAVFDTFLADRALAPLGVVRPSPRQWLPVVVRAAERRAWSRPAHQINGTSALTSRV